MHTSTVLVNIFKLIFYFLLKERKPKNIIWKKKETVKRIKKLIAKAIIPFHYFLLMEGKIYLHAITMTRFPLPLAYLSISFVSAAFFWLCLFLPPLRYEKSIELFLGVRNYIINNYLITFPTLSAFFCGILKEKKENYFSSWKSDIYQQASKSKRNDRYDMAFCFNRKFNSA